MGIILRAGRVVFGIAILVLGAGRLDAGDAINEAAYASLLRSQERALVRELRLPDLDASRRGQATRLLSQTRALLSPSEPANKIVYVKLLRERESGLRSRLAQGDLSPGDRSQTRRAWIRTRQLIREMQSGYLVGAARGFFGAALRRGVTLRPFDGRLDRPVYIDAAALDTLSVETMMRIRKVAQQGQMIVLLSPAPAGIRRFRNLLGVEKDIANTNGPVMAVRRVQQDYAEFTANPVGGPDAARLAVTALSEWRWENLQLRAKAAGESARRKTADASNLINVASSYIGTHIAYSPGRIVTLKFNWAAVPCYAGKSDSFFIWVEQSLTYVAPASYTMEDVRKEKGRLPRNPSVRSSGKGWIGLSNFSTALGSLKANVLQSQPASNGSVVTTYTNSVGYDINGSVSFFDLKGGLEATGHASYEKTSTVTIDGALITNQEGTNTAKWLFKLNEPQRNPQKFPLLNSVTTWIWQLPRSEVSSLPTTESIEVTAQTESETTFSLPLNYDTSPPDPMRNSGDFSFEFQEKSSFQIALPPTATPGEPEITGVVPNTGKAGLKVKISGQRLKNLGTEKPTVLFNNAPAFVTGVTNTEITVIVPQRTDGDLEPFVTVITDHGDSNQLTFTYTQ